MTNERRADRRRDVELGLGRLHGGLLERGDVHPSCPRRPSVPGPARVRTGQARATQSSMRRRAMLIGGGTAGRSSGANQAASAISASWQVISPPA